MLVNVRSLALDAFALGLPAREVHVGHVDIGVKEMGQLHISSAQLLVIDEGGTVG